MLTMNWDLNGDVKIQTVVTSQGGGTHNVATINILSAGRPLWSNTLIATACVGVVHSDIVIGSGDSTTTIFAGTRFTLMVPSEFMNGDIAAEITYHTSEGRRRNYSGVIASWPLPQ